jgi:hypothetical protein
MMVTAHCIRIAGQVLAGKEARNAAQGLVWRRKDEGAKGEAPRKVTS